ncbi:MAG: SDR family oxidoreductase [Thermoguttaceae bacterium]
MSLGDRILVTGGSGLLGGELRKLLPSALFPLSSEFNATDVPQMAAYFEVHRPRIVLHAAAFTSPPKIDRDPEKALAVNIMGTAGVVSLCAAHAARMVYVSTDYVFRGDQGNYCEEDPVYPVNKYAWSKLGGECAVRLYDNSLIVRTTFGPNVFPYEKAFVDQWTSRQSVREIAVKLVPLLESDATGVVHVGGPRRTVYEYASSLDPAKPIQKLSIHEVSFRVPVDTSLNCRRYDALLSYSREA